MNIKNTLAASVAGAALFALAAPMTASNANAGISNGNKNSLVISGQIVRSLLYADDGHKSDVFQTDGGTETSRLRFVVTSQLNESTSVGGIISMDTPLMNDMTTASLDNLPTTRISDTSNFSTRKDEISITHKRFGTLTFGKGSVATDGTDENGLDMGLLSAGVPTRPTVGAFNFRNSAGATTSVSAGTVFDDLNPLDRTVRVRYDTPTVAGFTASGDWIDGSAGDVALTYSGKFAGTAIDAIVGYMDKSGIDTTVDSAYGGSVGFEHDSGIGAALTYLKEKTNNTTTLKPSVYGGGLSYTANLYSGGATKADVTYAEYKDRVTKDDKGKSWQVGLLQNFDSVGMDAGLMYTHFAYSDNTSTNYDGISTVLFSTRLQF